MSKTVGEYVLKEKIGKGSFADVYKGTHKVTGLKYAIKAISKEILSEPKLLAGLESEIKIMREFSHQNIVCLHEYFSSEKNFYLVLELCEGGDLSKFIRKKKRLDERLAHNFLTQIASGLAFLHDRNFIHRDLKPANVLLSENSDNAILKLADFGFARQLNVAALAQTRCGTPLYMAPEILESKDYDGKADVWSVGCIFYEMLVGTSPFKGLNEGDLLMNIKTKELNVPKEVVLSKVSIEILIKLLERQPIRRASLAQLVALCAHLSSTAQTATAPGTGPGTGGDDAALQLPLPSPSPSADVRSPELAHSRRPPLGDTPDAGANRRRFSSAADPNEAAFDPNYVSPARAPTGGRNYGGGPAPSNLHGMLDGNANTTFAGTPQKSTPATPQSQHDGGYGGNNAGRRHSTGGLDPHFSRTLRAPYAGAPPVSSSPPTGYSAATTAASAVGGFLQSVTAPVTASHVAASSSGASPATGTMGMVGNLIAYVFNPSPSPSSAQADASRSYAGAQGRYHQHGASGRAISSDRAMPPNFGSGAFAGGNGGAVTPPPGSAAKGPRQSSSSDRRLREDYFAHPDAIDGGYVNTRSPKHGLGNGSTSMEEDDFVLINKSASDMDRKAGIHGYHGPSAGAGHRAGASVPPGSTSVSSSSSGGTSTSTTMTNSLAGGHNGPAPGTTHGTMVGIGIGGLGSSGVPPGAARHAAMIPVEYNMEYDAHANELAAVQAFYSSLVQRCQVYSAVVAAITALGDHYIRECQPPTQRQPPGMRHSRADGSTEFSGNAGSRSAVTAVSDEEEDDSIAGFLQPTPDLLSPFAKQVTVDRHLVACSLYLHALGILTRLMKSFENNDILEQPELQQALPVLKQPLTAAFEQLIARAETCQKHIDAMVNPTGRDGAGAGKYVMPQPEPIMLQAALQREADAGPEELLGNLPMACKLYQSAYDLVEGVALTANDTEDQRKLYAYSASLLEKLNSCKQRAAELFHYNS